jgi:cytosine/adenosine deaminase-related metal-dependent hydrolase
MSGPIIPEAAVLIDDGKILAVGPQTDLRKDHPDAIIRDLGNSVLLPGLVNAHTHLELSGRHPGPPPTEGFAGWLGEMIRKSHTSQQERVDGVTRGVEIGIEHCVRFGVTAIGDISRHNKLTRSLLAASPLRVVSYGEVTAMAQRRGLLEECLALAADESSATDRLTIGITPHAPYSVETDGYRRCLQTAISRKMPLATHLAETADERAFLESHTGSLRELWNQYLPWDDQVPTFSGGPIRFARDLGLLDYPTLLAHVNYCDDDELSILAAGKASVALCPRTHEYFNHPPHRWREMLTRGINVAIGTDSCASSPDLNLVDDLRLLHRQSPQTPVPLLWELATTRAARAIGVDNAGIIRPGMAADLVAFAVTTGDPLSEILEGEMLPESVFLGGKVQ